MGYGITPTEGPHDGGFCPSCEHTDCASSRKLVSDPCCICGDTMGQDVKFFFRNQEPCHALCVWEEQEG